MKHAGMTRATRTMKRGFTLIELLVVVSIIALLIGILLPGLGRANKLAKTTVCLSQQRGMGQNFVGWSNDNDDLVPGVNAPRNLLIHNNAQNAALPQMIADPYAPTQSYDWITPIMANDSVSPEREARFFQAFNNYACPEQDLEVVVYAGGSDPGGMRADEYLARDRSVRPLGPSYLMSLYFQLGGRDIYSGGLGGYTFTQIGSSVAPAINGTAVIPANYRPKIPLVGDPSQKIAFADGFRYIDDDSGLVDVDASFAPSYYGAFTSGGAMYSREVSYGSNYYAPRRPQLDASYRHAGQLNAAFFDGHAETLEMAESRNPSLWLPSGSRWVGGDAMEECFSYYEEGETVN